MLSGAPFRTAVETGDIDRVLALVSPDVVFNSPVVYRPYHGREVLGVILRAVMRVFEDFHIGRDGLIEELSVMVRPRSAALALAVAMNAEVLALQRELGVERR
jgi:ketosteroid isomerase-like protein